MMTRQRNRRLRPDLTQRVPYHFIGTGQLSLTEGAGGSLRPEPMARHKALAASITKWVRIWSDDPRPPASGTRPPKRSSTASPFFLAVGVPG
jgi:hypothetical protein